MRVPREQCETDGNGRFAQEWAPLCSPRLSDADSLEEFILRNTFSRSSAWPSVQWVHDPEACATEPLSHECTPGGWRYPTAANDAAETAHHRTAVPLRQLAAPCDALRAAGVQRIKVVGDSFARQAMNGIMSGIVSDLTGIFRT